MSWRMRASRIPRSPRLMNALFVNIKVDREERPDLDAIYMHALTLMGEQGGWPLTMFLTPAGEPFWGGTYFPPSARWGRPGFPEVLQRDRRSLSRQARPGREERRRAAARAGASSARPSRATASPIDAGRPRARCALVQEVDAHRGRHRRCAQIPASAGASTLLWRGGKRLRHAARCASAVTADARPYLPGRHLRSSRRRLRALFGRPRTGSRRISRRCSTTTRC